MYKVIRYVASTIDIILTTSKLKSGVITQKQVTNSGDGSAKENINKNSMNDNIQVDILTYISLSLSRIQM